VNDRALASDMLAALKAIRRWCDIQDNRTDSADKVRHIRLVADDFLTRVGAPYDNRTYNARRRFEEDVNSNG